MTTSDSETTPVPTADANRYVYVFIRTDIPTEHQLVQSGHALYHLASNFRPDPSVPNIIAIGVPHVAALERVKAKLELNKIPHYIWREPDHDFGFTAIATSPLDDKQKLALSNYRLLSHHSPGTSKDACLLNQDGGAKAGVAQKKEQRAFSPKVAGSTPASGSNSISSGDCVTALESQDIRIVNSF